MAGMNEHYHLAMNSNLKGKLQQKADEEGIFLSELIRIIFWDWLRKDKTINYLKKIEEKLDKILKKS